MPCHRFLTLYGPWLCIFLTLAGCTLPVSRPQSDTQATGHTGATPVRFDDVERRDPHDEAGRRLHEQLLAAYGGAYQDVELERSLAHVVGRIVSVTPGTTRAYRLTILDSPNVNAFALANGYVYVTRGLLALANDQSEVAAVLAHEIAHVEAGHGVERARRRAAIAAASSHATGKGINGTPVSTEALARSELGFAQFSREQEFEADAMGVRISHDAGYDAMAAARFLASMQRFTGLREAFQAYDPSLDFLSTHPATALRIARVEATVSELGIDQGGADRARHLSAIDGMVFGHIAREGYVRGRSFRHAVLGIAFDVPEGFLIDNRKVSVHAVGPGDRAIQVDREPIPENMSLLDYADSGWINALDRSSIRSSTSNGLETVTATATVGAYAFSIQVFRVGNDAYRLVMAYPVASTAESSVLARDVGASFRILSEREIAALRPLRIRIVQARPGDDQRSMAARMVGIVQTVGLFQVLNGLRDGDRIVPGESYKIVSD